MERIKTIIANGQSYGVGAVQPGEKTADMTAPVGMDEDGRLWVKPVEEAEKLPYTSEGYSAGYFLHSPGWKRIAVLTRSHSGIASVGLGINSGACGRTFQNVMFAYSGYARFPTGKNSGSSFRRGWDLRGKPALFQISDTTFGEDPLSTEPERIFRIDRVRMAFPKDYTQIPGTGDERYADPVHVYLDIHITADKAVDWEGMGDELQLLVNLSGKTRDGSCVPITTETDCTDPVTGLEGVACDTAECVLTENAGMVLPDMTQAQELCVETLYLRKKETVHEYPGSEPVHISAREGATAIRILNCQFGYDISGMQRWEDTFHIQPLNENMIVDKVSQAPIWNAQWERTRNGITFRRYANGYYCLSGSSTKADVLKLFTLDPGQEGTYSNPVILKAGVAYDCYACQLEVTTWQKYLRYLETGNFDDLKPFTYYYGVDAATHTHPQICQIPVSQEDRVVVYAGIHQKATTVYTAPQLYYPQLCLRGKVIQTYVLANQSLDWQTLPPPRRMPYSPFSVAVTLPQDAPGGFAGIQLDYGQRKAYLDNTSEESERDREIPWDPDWDRLDVSCMQSLQFVADDPASYEHHDVNIACRAELSTARKVILQEE